MMLTLPLQISTFRFFSIMMNKRCSSLYYRLGKNDIAELQYKALTSDWLEMDLKMTGPMYPQESLALEAILPPSMWPQVTDTSSIMENKGHAETSSDTQVI